MTARMRSDQRAAARVLGLLVCIAAALMLFMFAVESFGPEWLLDPGNWQTEASLAVALLSVALLVSDILLPIPSSVVLVANGVVFGPVAGSIVSIAGLVVASGVGYLLGRRGQPHARRALGTEGAELLTTRLERHGLWLIAATRAIPLASELAALTAGSSRLPVGRYLVASAFGAAVAAIPLALIGSGTLTLGTRTTIVAAAIAAAMIVALTTRNTSARGRLGTPRLSSIGAGSRN